ncbi:DNA replication/repair protein RecF [Vulgatibacter incomptus]|uniref:DNA replication and repair protein RecF n=1 Tax=Vulgatibacter incomptus TaxID=1391653 RepID=A0A0K1PH56_9BACT|nr:DNA replication/repair protein RecF [Vulgatibacter incomptus]AKU92842.1 DNA recombination and repair protein RecF [Vulgatibacter incomptus]
MRLLDLRLRDFRNIEAARVDLGPRATVVVGPNGQGKTNLLEAVYFLATLKPLRTSRLSELPRFGAKGCKVEGSFELGATTRVFGVEVADGSRQAFVDGKKVRELEDYFGGVSVVAFTPDDLALVKGGPELRRRFLDRAVFNRFPGYLGESRDYARALKSRNRLLREGARLELVEAFDAPLARQGARLVARRLRLVDELAPRFETVLAGLSRGQLEGALRYAPKVAEGGVGEEEIAARLLEELSTRLPRDRERGYTSVGPHADTLGIKLAGRPARAYASQGQQRALVLALKIGEIENLRESLGYQPLLLLDDVSSELDRERNEQLCSYLASLDGQVLLTTTDPELLGGAAGPDARFYAVREGTFAPLDRAS